LRDRHHGRIYRVVYEDAPAQPAMSLEGASPERLVETLRHDNMLWRMHAQRLLVERGQTDVTPGLLALVADQAVDEIGLNVGAIHALWTLHGLGQLGGQNAQALNAARAALRHPSSAVRSNAVQVLPQAAQSVQAILSSGALDDDAHVRLRALVALADMPASDDAGRAVYALLAQPASMEDTWIRRAGSFAAAAHARGFLGAAGEAGMIARVNAQRAPENVLPNAGFESVSGGQPEGWTGSARSGAPVFAAESRGRNGGRALVIRAAEGADASWVGPEIPLKPRRQYRLSGWIRAAQIDRGEGRGALLNLSGVPGALGRTESVTEPGNWVYRERVFTTTSQDTAAVNLTLGGGEPSTGEVWFDDVALVELGPEPGTTLESIVVLVMQRAPGALAVPDARQAPAADVVLELGVVPEELRFDRTELRVGAGQRVNIVFTNTDNMEHNLLIIRPGTVEEVGAMADALATPAGRAQQYVPDSPDVIVSTPILQPTQSYALNFTAPTEPGRYTFVCTIPGHWRVMQGTLIVE
ncbi:MAG: plastocyanin/azurin family copper-binding protein, partial [Gemmatimonadota bacterium]